MRYHGLLLFASPIIIWQKFRKWANRQWQEGGKRVRGRAKSLRGGQNRVKGHFRNGVFRQKWEGIGAETRSLPYPWKGETKGREIEGEEGELSSS